MESGCPAPTRRHLLHAIGLMGGTAAVYQMMTTFAHAAESRFPGPPKLDGARTGAAVIVPGAGLAGMLAAYEQPKAGYCVPILEYQDRPRGAGPGRSAAATP